MPTKKKKQLAKKRKPPTMTLRDVCNVLEGIDTRLAEALDPPSSIERLIASIDRLSAQIEKEAQPEVEQLLAPEDPTTPAAE